MKQRMTPSTPDGYLFIRLETSIAEAEIILLYCASRWPVDDHDIIEMVQSRWRVTSEDGMNILGSNHESIRFRLVRYLRKCSSKSTIQSMLGVHRVWILMLRVVVNINGTALV